MSGGLWRATVTRTAGPQVWATIPRLGARGREYGPMDGLPGVTLTPGDRLLIGLLEDDPNAPAIVRKLP